jgi:3-phosphoshikimate 1-carboxyvinyltransferase
VSGPLLVEPVPRLVGHLAVPGDKSISHRAVLIGALCDGETRVSGFGRSADTEATIAAVRALGVEVYEHGAETLRVFGKGLRGLVAPSSAIDCGNAGTLVRLLAGILAGQSGQEFQLTGDASLSARPMGRIAEPLGRMGAGVETTEGHLPMGIRARTLSGIDYALPVASAQVKSAILLAGLYATGETTVVEPAPTRDHTERMLAAAGAAVEREAIPQGGFRTTVSNTDELELEVVEVPGDLSSAAFLIAAGVLVRDSRLVLERVGVNWTRTGFLRILERMGAIVLADGEAPGSFGPHEPVADIDVRNAPIEGTTVQADEVPLAIDELPLVALMGCFADGETVVHGAQELRIKESDRIATVVEGLRGLGADIEALPDGFVVRGAGRLRGGRLDAHGDHRLALLGAVAGLASETGVEVLGMEAAEVSYPRFAEHVSELIA